MGVANGADLQGIRISLSLGALYMTKTNREGVLITRRHGLALDADRPLRRSRARCVYESGSNN